METKAKTIIQTIVCVGLVCMIWGGYFIANRKIATDKHHQITLYKNDFSWVYQIDSIEAEGKGVILRGFAFELDKNAAEGDFEIVLHDVETGENYFPKMKYMERRDVNDYFMCKYDYLHSGFEAKIVEKGFDLQKKDYEVILRIAGEKIAYRTGTYIEEGKLVYANPLEFVPLDVVGTDLEKIVEDGVLRVYRPDYGIYVYQYGGALYWIADENYGFVDNDCYLQFQLYTTQVEKLPTESIEKRWSWSDQWFMFCAKEISEWNTGKYRVAKCNLPEEYAVTSIVTGYYTSDWVWVSNFQPWYEALED